jgi:hypothetical protein
MDRRSLRENFLTLPRSSDTIKSFTVYWPAIFIQCASLPLCFKRYIIFYTKTFFTFILSFTRGKNLSGSYFYKPSICFSHFAVADTPRPATPHNTNPHRIMVRRNSPEYPSCVRTWLWKEQQQRL